MILISANVYRTQDADCLSRPVRCLTQRFSHSYAEVVPGDQGLAAALLAVVAPIAARQCPALVSAPRAVLLERPREPRSWSRLGQQHRHEDRQASRCGPSGLAPGDRRGSAPRPTASRRSRWQDLASSASASRRSRGRSREGDRRGGRRLRPQRHADRQHDQPRVREREPHGPAARRPHPLGRAGDSIGRVLRSRARRWRRGSTSTMPACRWTAGASVLAAMR